LLDLLIGLGIGVLGGLLFRKLKSK
jgi:hypothetical protein